MDLIHRICSHLFFAFGFLFSRLSVIASTKADEVTILAVDPDLPRDSTWPIQWWLVGEAESQKIIVPMDEEFKETYVLGLSIDTTNKFTGKPPADNQAERKEDDQELAPAVFMLTSNGRLHAYRLLSNHGGQKAIVSQLMKPADTVVPLSQARNTFKWIPSKFANPPAEHGQPDQPAPPPSWQPALPDSSSDEEGDVSSADDQDATQPPTPDGEGQRRPTVAPPDSGVEGEQLKSPPPVGSAPPASVPFSFASKPAESASAPFVFALSQPTDKNKGSTGPSPPAPAFSFNPLSGAMPFSLPSSSDGKDKPAAFSMNSGAFSFPPPAGTKPEIPKSVNPPASSADRDSPPPFVAPTLPAAKSVKKNLQFSDADDDKKPPPMEKPTTMTRSILKPSQPIQPQQPTPQPSVSPVPP